MSTLRDDELRRNLDRRLQTANLDEHSRARLLESISDQVRSLPRRRHRQAWRFVRLAPLAASVAALALVGAVVAPSLVPPGGPGVSPTPAPEVRVINTVELEAAVGRAAPGDVFLADGYPSHSHPTVCDGGLPCWEVTLQGVHREFNFRIPGSVDEPPEMSLPLALRWEGDDLTFLGFLTRAEGGLVWSVAEALDNGRADGLLAVDGWLVETPPVSCPAPGVLHDGDAGNDDLRWYCGGSWLTEERTYTVGESSGAPLYALEIPGALHVQAGAYADYARNPKHGDRGAEPRFGVYLIREAGCPEAVSGDCPVWEMLGRLDPLPHDLLTPPPTPSDPAVIPVRTSPPATGMCRLRANSGRLAPHPDTGLGIAGTLGDVHAVQWPSGYYGMRGPDGLQLFDARGTLVAEEGDLLEFGGADSDGAIVACPGTIENVTRRPPSPSPSPSPSPVEPSQHAILGAVARWLVDDDRLWPEPRIYVHSVVVEEMGEYHFGPMSRDPDTATAGPPLFAGPMTEATKTAIESALAHLRVEFVADPQAAVDPDAFDHLGCRPYFRLDDMLHFGPPHPSRHGDHYYVYVNIDQGCAGVTYVVEVTPTENGYEVTRVVVTTSWIV